jgi:rSAM/selenodomain-associated transferase 2
VNIPHVPLVSVIVPVWADRAAARTLLGQLSPDPRVEVIVVEAESVESPGESIPLAPERADVRVLQTARGRARQMNAGAALARGHWLLFLHADSTLPGDWLAAFETAIQPPAIGGWFRFALDDRSWQARLFERGVALRVRVARLPYGDQGLFLTQSAFDALGGYRDMPLMEDVDLVRRLVAHGPVVEVPCAIVTSARRYRKEGWFRRSARNLVLLSLYFAGVSPTRLARWYGVRPPSQPDSRA